MVKIGTHNGTFHCDEVLACVLLKQLPQYKDAEIVRSRDLTILNSCDIVVDVGAIFDPNSNKYDHHQRSFHETFKSLRPEKPWDIKLSSAGLVYVYFGREVLTEITKKKQSDIDIDVLYNKIYENFILEVDAIDNGVSIFDGEPRYNISTNLSSRIANLNPWWNKPNDSEEDQFKKAMVLAEVELFDKVDFYLQCWWPARQMVKDAVNNRFSVHDSGSIIKFSHGGCPWKSHFYDIEIEMFSVLEGDVNNSNQNKILFAIYADKETWRIQCIPISENRGFENRLGLCEKWRGIRDEELSKQSGISDCIFVHASGFIGGNKTYEGALQMAIRTMEYSKTN